MNDRYIALSKVPKSVGGRMENVETYIAFCDGMKDTRPDGWLVAKKSIKTPESDDIFGHVVLAVMNGKRIIVKVFEEISPMLKPELAIMKLLSNKKQNNVIQYICDFSCHDSKIKWNKEIENNSHFCVGNDALHFILMEYIKDGDIYSHLASPKLTSDQMKSVIKQVGLCLLQLGLNHNITHGDIHHGNILIQRRQGVQLTYKFKNKSIDVYTHGIEPVFIDFGRAHKSTSSHSKRNNTSNNNSDLSGLVDLDDINWKIQEVLQTYDLIRHILKNKKHKKFVAQIIRELSTYTKDQMDEVIDFIGAL